MMKMKVCFMNNNNHNINKNNIETKTKQIYFIVISIFLREKKKFYSLILT